MLVVCAAAPRRFTAEDLRLLRLAADRVALGDRPRARLRARAQDRRDAPAQPAAGPPAAAAGAGGGGALPAGRRGGRGRRRLVRRDPDPRAAASGLVMGDVAGKGLAAASMVGRLRSALRAYALEGHDPAAASSSSSTG